jgi:hypothetical protein
MAMSESLVNQEDALPNLLTANDRGLFAIVRRVPVDSCVTSCGLSTRTRRAAVGCGSLALPRLWFRLG